MNTKTFHDYEQGELEYLEQNLRTLSEHLGPLDSQVRMLAQAVALQVARARSRFDAAWVEARRTLQTSLDPFPLEVVPTRQIVETVPSADAPLDGERFDRNCRLAPSGVRSPDGDVEFTTTRPLTVWPLKVVGPVMEGDSLSFELRLDHADPSVMFSSLNGFDRLELYLDGGAEKVFPVHEAMLRAGFAWAFPPGDTVEPSHVSIRPVGLDDSEGFLPHSGLFLHGERLLSEFFLFPESFQFVEVAGLAPAASRAARIIKVRVQLPSSDTRITEAVRGLTLRANCVPTVNLVEESTNVEVASTRDLHPVVPNVRRPDQLEVAAITAVETNAGVVPPLYGVRHTYGGPPQAAFWQSIRRMAENRASGTEVFLRLVERARQTERGPTLSVKMRCCHGDRPARTQVREWKFVDRARLARVISRVLPPLRATSDEFWLRGPADRVAALTSVRRLGVISPEAGARVIRSLLEHRALLDWEPADDLRSGNTARRELAESLLGSITEATARSERPEAGGQDRLRLTDIRVRGSSCPGGSWYLFGKVLDRFLADLCEAGSRSGLRIASESGSHEWPQQTAKESLN